MSLCVCVPQTQFGHSQEHGIESDRAERKANKSAISAWHLCYPSNRSPQESTCGKSTAQLSSALCLSGSPSLICDLSLQPHSLSSSRNLFLCLFKAAGSSVRANLHLINFITSEFSVVERRDRSSPMLASISRSLPPFSLSLSPCHLNDRYHVKSWVSRIQSKHIASQVIVTCKHLHFKGLPWVF